MGSWTIMIYWGRWNDAWDIINEIRKILIFVCHKAQKNRIQWNKKLSLSIQQKKYIFEKIDFRPKLSCEGKSVCRNHFQMYNILGNNKSTNEKNNPFWVFLSMSIIITSKKIGLQHCGGYENQVITKFVCSVHSN